MLENTLFVYKCEKDSNENIIKILAIATLSLLLQAKATLSIDGYMPNFTKKLSMAKRCLDAVA